MGEDIGAGSCGGVVGVGVVDLDIVDGGLVGGLDIMDGDGMSMVITQVVARLDLACSGEALALDVEGGGLVWSPGRRCWWWGCGRE